MTMDRAIVEKRRAAHVDPPKALGAAAVRDIAAALNALLADCFAGARRRTPYSGGVPSPG
jgi:hypothetical protein